MSLRNIIFYLLAAFVAGTLVLVYVQYNFTKSITNLNRGNQQYINEYNINSVLRELEKDVVKIESNISNFVATGNDDFVKGMNAMIERARHDMLSLQRFADDSATMALISRLDSAVSSKLAFSGSILDTVNKKGKNAAEALIKTLVGKQLMDSVFEYAEQIKSVRYDRLEQLNKSNIRNGRRAEKLNYILIGLTLASAAILFWYIISIIQRLIDSEKKVKEAARVKESFLANMSHEIRTPMNAILGFTALLDRQPLNKRSKEYVHTIQNSGESLLSIINDILDLSKIESGMMRVESAPFSIRGLLHSVKVMFGSKVAEKNLHLYTEIDEGIPGILEGDATKLTQILVNLIGNALKFTKEGRISIHITEERREGNRIYTGIAVKDTGIGIESDKLEKIFNRFQQADEAVTRQYGGTGLGLSIVKEFVSLLNGTIKVESEPGKGTCFFLTIPYVVAENQNTERSEDPAPGDGSVNGNFKNKHILVAEDNEINQSLIKHLFTRWKLSYDMAQNGKAAIDLLRQKKYDLILMDIQMPEMDGYTAVKEIRESLRLTTPVIAMTAHALAGEREKCLSYGMDEYISKPIRESRLHQLIARFTQTDPENTMSEKTGAPDQEYDCIHLGYMKEISGGNTAYEKEVTAQFIEAIPETLSALEKAWENKDISLVKHLAHDMKTTVSVMGLTASLQPHLDSLEYDDLTDEIFYSRFNFLQTVCNKALSEAQRYYRTLHDPFQH